MIYDYNEEVLRDLRLFLEDNPDLMDVEDNDEFAEELADRAWIADSVTGNGSGSYFFNRYKAAEALCSNMDLLQEMLHEFYGDTIAVDKLDPEGLDVGIRCHVLHKCVQDLTEETEKQRKKQKCDDDEDRQED